MPQTTQEKSRINRVLGNYGLPQLGSNGLMEALAFLVGQDPEPEVFFRSLLMKCEPEERRHMYEALRPHLSFTAKPLDVYLSELGSIAECKQLPTVTPEGGLAPFRVPEISMESLEEAIIATRAKGSLELVCRKCTREAEFLGARKADAIQEARRAGWTYGLDPKGDGRELCPDCDKPALSREDFKLVTEFKAQSLNTIHCFMRMPAGDGKQSDWDAAALVGARRWDAAGRPSMPEPEFPVAVN